MQSIALVIHVALAIGLIGLVLIQHGKGADAGAAFGSGASATVFGARGSASFMTRMTTGVASAFFVTSLFLFYLAAHRDRGLDSVTDAPGSVIEQPAATDEELPGGVAPPEEQDAGEGDLAAPPAAGDEASGDNAPAGGADTGAELPAAPEAAESDPDAPKTE